MRSRERRDAAAEGVLELVEPRRRARRRGCEGLDGRQGVLDAMVKLTREEGLALLGMVAGCESAVTLHERTAQLEQGHDLACQRLQREGLQRREIADIVVEHAQCSERK